MQINDVRQGRVCVGARGLQIQTAFFFADTIVPSETYIFFFFFFFLRCVFCDRLMNV